MEFRSQELWNVQLRNRNKLIPNNIRYWFEQCLNPNPQNYVDHLTFDAIRSDKYKYNLTHTLVYIAYTSVYIAYMLCDGNLSNTCIVSDGMNGDIKQAFKPFLSTNWLLTIVQLCR